MLTCGDLRMDVPGHEATFAGRHLDLTPKEFGMLAALARHPGRILTHRALLHEVWGPGYDTETHYLRVYASQLRKKLGPDGCTDARGRARHRVPPRRPDCRRPVRRR